MPYVYGPVRSRRLGLSLGVDPVPLKTCNLNCVYCQLGPTSLSKGVSPAYPPVSAVLHDTRKALTPGGVIDHVTVSGSGEPTLYPDLGPLIRGIKAMTRIPLAVMTNGTLLSSRDVRESLCQADAVLPSLDAADNPTFNRIARPPGGLDVGDVIAGLVVFRRQFCGQFWLEVLLIHGLNDTPAHLSHLKAAIDIIKPDRIHLNTVVRPPASEWALAVPSDRMADIASYLGPQCEVIADPPRKVQGAALGEMPELIIQAVKRRPMTMQDLTELLGAMLAQVSPCVTRLLGAGVIQSRLYQGRRYYLFGSESEREVT